MVRWYRLSQNANGAVLLEEQGKRKVTCKYCNFGRRLVCTLPQIFGLILYGIEHRDTGPNRTVYYEEFRARSTQSALPSGG